MIQWMAGYANHSIIGAKDVNRMAADGGKQTLSPGWWTEVDLQLADLAGLCGIEP
jgi:hypothetical protein